MESDEQQEAFVDALPEEVEEDRRRGEREKAPDNAEERVIHERGLGFISDHVVASLEAQGEMEREGGPDSAGDGNGTSLSDDQGGPEEDKKAADVELIAGADMEVEGEAEEQRVGEEEEEGRPKTVLPLLKRKVSATSDAPEDAVVKKPKKKTNVWTKTSTRKSSKKTKVPKPQNGDRKDECIEVNPSQRYQLEEKNGIQLSKEQKAEKVELSLDKLQASSEKGYRMVRATRGITDGAWYFEVTVKDLGKTGHTRLGWSTWKGDLQAPVGFDANSYAYRDVDGSKVHQAVREPYGEAYAEGDVIGFYINLPNGAEYAPKYELYVNKATRTVFPVAVEKTEGPPKRVPGSEISFFKNGVCQGVSYKDVFAGEYFPAASMYTLPAPEKKCSVRFNFGPIFSHHPEDWGERPVPRPMSQAAPPEGLVADTEEPPPPVNGTKETKNADAVSGTASKLGNKQRMAAERGNGTEEGGGVRSKRVTDERDKGKRTGVTGKKGPFGKGPKKSHLLPPNDVVESPVSDSELQIEVNLEGCSNEGSADLEPGPHSNEAPQSSDERTE